jgi:uncharacterized protein (TIGR03435 family)
VPPETEEGMLTNSFDLLYTKTEPREKFLQEEIAKRFGYQAHWEKRETNVYLLKVSTQNSPNLKTPENKNGSSTYGKSGQLVMKNQSLSSLATSVERMVRVPVLDRTGLKNHYDMTLKIKQTWPVTPKDQVDAALRELGLELVPSRETIDMLVVEKTK